MELDTIINYLFFLSDHFYLKREIVMVKRIFRLVSILWWFDVIVPMFIACGESLC